jgi:hypothetical protein
MVDSIGKVAHGIAEGWKQLGREGHSKLVAKAVESAKSSEHAVYREAARIYCRENA